VAWLATTEDEQVSADGLYLFSFRNMFKTLEQTFYCHFFTQCCDILSHDIPEIAL